MEKAPKPSEVFGAQVRRVRIAKGWESQQRLVDRLEDLGHFTNRSTVTRLENGTRSAGMDEMFAVAAALEVSPLALALPHDDKDPVAVTPALEVSAGEARAWATGEQPLPGQDAQFFESQSPDFWVDVMTLRRQAVLRQIVEDLAEADESGNKRRRTRILDRLEEEVRRQKGLED